MKTLFQAPPRRKTSGNALVMVMVMSGALILIFATTLGRTYTESKLNDRNSQFSTSLNAAEAATEKVLARMRSDYITYGLGTITNNLSVYRSMVPSTNECSYWRNFTFSDGQGNAGMTYVQCISNSIYGPLQSQFAGLYAYYPVYRILSNVKMNTSRSPVTAAVQEDVTFNQIPIFQFAIFYNSLLEFTWAAPFTIRGRVQANGNIYEGSSSALTFYGTVTTTGTITKPAWAGYTTSQYTGSITYDGSPTYTTNVAYVMLPLGTNNVHSIIDMPPSGESPMSSLGQQRLYNEAEVVILVSNTVVTTIIQAQQNGLNPGSDPSPVILTSTNTPVAVSSNFPFLSLTNTFTDQRENKTIVTSQINIGLYSQWLSTNASVLSKFPAGSGSYPTILYIADNRTNNASQLTAVRVTNGVSLPSNGGYGFSLATPNPLYVWGNYNCTNSAYLGTTNTSATVPSSLISDALTILSGNWVDSQSSLSLSSGSKNAAVNDTVNTAIITGIVYSGANGSPFSGGVMNLPRLLENWGNGGATTLTLNTSIVNLFASTRATNVWQSPGNYYYAPTRQFNYDLNFSNPNRQPPPASPNLMVMLRSSWAQPPPNNVAFYVTP